MAGHPQTSEVRVPRKSQVRREDNLRKASVWRRYAFGWVTAGFFVLSLTGHWIFGWFAYVDDQRQHNQPVEATAYVVEMMRDTLENWQSEFLQLLWQVGGLALLLYVSSPQSSEGDHRQEEKLDAILRSVNPKEAEKIIADIDHRLARTK
jgi:hypothetical protein